jgi:hypothetical protein
MAGWGHRQAATLQFWKDRAVAAADSPDPDPPALKQFVPKFNLPKVENYRIAASAQFWKYFPVNHNMSGKSPVSATRLRSWGNAVGCADRERLGKVCKDLENGADIGCRGPAREASECSNAPSAYECGAQVTDAIAEWVLQGIAAGPFHPKDRQLAKVSGVMCRMKPNVQRELY